MGLLIGRHGKYAPKATFVLHRVEFLCLVLLERSVSRKDLQMTVNVISVRADFIALEEKHRKLVVALLAITAQMDH